MVYLLLPVQKKLPRVAAANAYANAAAKAAAHAAASTHTHIDG